ncbi:hypothetical protein CL633_04145 [bacterium]|nr:hypothetical protein [bacterium]|tara:strand:- start:194 stop:1285 length:1092 start_codon:yes stop_codon:yes gene_type:complete
MKNKNFFHAIAILIGTIIGVGVFGIPYAAAQSGFLITLIYLLGLGFIAIFIHLFYGEIVTKTRGKHRLIGYAEKYLGKWGKRTAFVSSLLGRWGALLAYIIVSGHFAQALLGGSNFFWSIILFIIGSIAIFFGLKLIAKLEFFMTLLLIGFMLIIFTFGFGHINLENLQSMNSFNLFLPYGVILFALGGITAIPEMKELIKKKTRLKLAIILGTLIPVVLFIIFTLVVVGVTGQQTTQEALIGLQKILGPKVMFIGLMFGILALATSFLTIGLNIKKIFWYDLGLGKNLSWFLACFVPLFAFLLGMRNFIDTIGLVGVILGGINGILICLIFTKIKKKKFLFLPSLVALIFLIGIFYQIWRGI